MRIVTWLTCKPVGCWNFTRQDSHLLSALLPGADIRICRQQEDFLRELPQAEVALVWRFDQKFFACAPRLRIIATPAAGMDYFDICPPPGVELLHGRFHGPIMAETVLGMILGHCRGIIDACALRNSDSWPQHALAASMVSLRGSHVVILGFGRIGQWVGRLAKPFGARISGVRRNLDAMPPDYFDAADKVLAVSQLDTVLPGADHLVLVLPHAADTDHIVDARRLALLPSHAAVYNVGRGNAIDETALAEALKAGSIWRACLDVFEEEPLAADSPLRSCPNAFLMPHASAIAPKYMSDFCHELADRIKRDHSSMLTPC